ncbi:unnamed protein product [Rhizophagus irregularis]|nr:unnamed protein product [Rhizophagus irregularis]
MSSKFLTELSSDYEKLFETELGYDVIIYAGEESNVKEIHAHSNILYGKFILKKPNISSHLFNIILRFIYWVWFISPTITSPTNVSPTNVSPTGLFHRQTFHRQSFHRHKK